MQLWRKNFPFLKHIIEYAERESVTVGRSAIVAQTNFPCTPDALKNIETVIISHHPRFDTVSADETVMNDLVCERIDGRFKDACEFFFPESYQKHIMRFFIMPFQCENKKDWMDISFQLNAATNQRVMYEYDLNEAWWETLHTMSRMPPHIIFSGADGFNVVSVNWPLHTERSQASTRGLKSLVYSSGVIPGSCRFCVLPDMDLFGTKEMHMKDFEKARKLLHQEEFYKRTISSKFS